MRQEHGELVVTTNGQGLVLITGQVRHWVDATGIASGLLTMFCRHTSASLLVQENASEAARDDLERYFRHIAPESDRYAHDEEGADDMPAHLRTALTDTSLSIPVVGHRPVLGTWQGIYLFEHRRAAHRRRIAVHLIGE
ncbi:secondary thiamine-phosphate synthase enzyme YjbQ [Sphingomonas sp. 2R-10]|uniref:secondary thiamine-phosphate synthase enzyme YjbQ n=1 Tax=Sphingomonas sp. 2R-10 TaxID=3045148 RepID=UPI000F79CAA6|nr:secondary thiamine-phosphate synthase enzyme YjbQ [Sphingomonas sp. 2R-10]MDJ0276853.1 secondary thiamine-phosphate synthase enzyme YjbQ [Sphingomonas sp. 2R-10]